MIGRNRPRTKYHTVNVNEDNVPDWPSNDGFRFVDKNGHVNVKYSSAGRVKNMHANIILFVMQGQWWFVLSLVLFGFLISWFFFAFLYFLISIEHGDFALTDDEQALRDNQTNYTHSYSQVQQEQCVKDVHNFLSALLFSIETQHTIGYGSRYITTECMGGILVLTLQSSLGYLLQVIVTQIVFTKLSRPAGKSQFVVFSDYALIAPRNDRLTLTFRIGNLSASQLIFASVRLLMIRQRRTREGEIIPHQIHDMEITHLRNGQLFFPRPNVVEHIINSRSPLYGIQRSTLEKQPFEIIAIIEGSFDHTGFSCHFRTSYLPNELLWGYRFSSCDSTLSGFDFAKFNYIEAIDVHPFWTYEEAESNSPTTPNTPLSSPSLPPKHVTKAKHRECLQRQKSFDETHYVHQKLNRLEPIQSLGPSSSTKDITSTDGDEEPSRLETVPSASNHSFVEKKIEFE